MKFRFKALMGLFCMAAASVSAQDAPQFSTDESTTWYNIQFRTGGAALQDMGSGQKLLTKALDEEAAAQKWKLVGTQSSFKLYSGDGNVVVYKDSRFQTASTGGTDLALVQSTNAANSDAWEIQLKSNTTQSLNQFGGTGVGKELGIWTKGDPNNPVDFLVTEAAAAQELFTPEFSNDSEEHYYYIQFSNGGNYIMDMGIGDPMLQTAKAMPDGGQMWKLVGTRDNFQLVSKNGHYMGFMTEPNQPNDKVFTASATPIAGGFKLHESTNASYPYSWEIQHLGTSGNNNRINAWRGASAGNFVGLWATPDPNNPLRFVKPESVKFSEYTINGSETYRPDNKLTLWYTIPANASNNSQQWMDLGLPLGNGQFGGHMMGGVAKDEITFNEKTLWTGSPTSRGSGGAGYGTYQNFGSLYIESLPEMGFNFEGNGNVADYWRALDLTTAVGTVHFTTQDGQTEFTRQYLASNPDGVIAVLLSANKPGAISVKFSMVPGMKRNHTVTYGDGTIKFSGKLDVVSYASTTKIVPTGGEMTYDSKGVTVKGADQVLVILGGATDFDAYTPTYTSGTAELHSGLDQRVDAAAAKGWDAIKADHIADHQSLFGRVTFDLEGSENNLPTNEMIAAYRTEAFNSQSPVVKMLEQLYFHYGRYLEIGSSRGVALPSNLQGIWSGYNVYNPYGSIIAPWNADIHANINVQMNYWPAEPTNLSELHEPFLNYIINMAVNQPQWQGYAKESGQTKGWTCYTENNIFGGISTFQTNYVIANAWYCTHLWQHYRYTLDKEFLARAFPAMWSCTEFWMERLVKATDGTWECPREYSPEHGPSSENATAHSQQLVAELFQNTIDAIDILGEASGVSEADFTALKEKYQNLDKGLATETYSGNWGTSISTGSKLLREWKYSTYTAGQNGHRHMSHLMALYPLSQITPESEFFTPAVNSMKLRGDGATGWSMGWKINLWARALDGDHARTLLHNALQPTAVQGSGVYNNLYDSHSPFQIDGNFGACSGIAEMLLQSHTGEISLLPALPTLWKAGTVSGLKAVGDFTVDIEWTKGRATKATILNNKGQELVVNYASVDTVPCYVNGIKVTPEVISSNRVRIPSNAGDKVELRFDEDNSSVVDVTAAAEQPLVSVSNRTLTVTSAARFTVYDLAGRAILTSTTASATVPESAGNVVLVSIVDQQGGTSAVKVILH